MTIVLHFKFHTCLQLYDINEMSQDYSGKIAKATINTETPPIPHIND